jgi:hypothetical protein
MNYMIDEKKVFMHTVEMSEHVNGAAQYLCALIGGRFVTREQARDMADYVLAQTKRNIESCPFASQEEKDAEIRRRENLMNMLKLQMEL